MTRDNVHPIRVYTQPLPPTTEDLLRDFDTLLADIALEHPDLEPGYHAAISLLRNRYRTWLAQQAGHPSTGGPTDGGPAA